MKTGPVTMACKILHAARIKSARLAKCKFLYGVEFMIEMFVILTPNQPGCGL
jgi:hypothetical protein